MCRHCTALGKAVTALHGARPLPLPVHRASPRLHFDFPFAACDRRAA
jgi:hypothetical protein